MRGFRQLSASLHALGGSPFLYITEREGSSSPAADILNIRCGDCRRRYPQGGLPLARPMSRGVC